MSEKTDTQFPDEIELGREVPDYGSPVAASSPSEAKEKTRTVYPCLYINGGMDLKKIPDEGCCMIRFKRVALTTRERDGDDKPDSECSVELDIHAICLKGGESSEGDEEEGSDLEEKFREFMEAQEKK